MCFIVHHYNFGNTRQFETLEEARAFTVRACFDAVIYSGGQVVARFSSIGGWR